METSSGAQFSVRYPCRSTRTIVRGAYDAINPWPIWKIVVLMMSVSAAGCFLRSVFLSPANQTIERGKKKTQIQQVFNDLQQACRRLTFRYEHIHRFQCALR